MPHEDEPSDASWKPALQKAFETLRDRAILVGHSVGGTILIKVLAEQISPRKPRAILARGIGIL
jgi:predicted alpha/beta hydrolase family esterase